MRHGTGGRRIQALTGSREEYRGPWGALLAACVLLLAACEDGSARAEMPASAGPSASKPALTVELAEVAYQGGVKPDWVEMGWTERQVLGPGPAKVVMANQGGWSLRRKSPL